MSGNLPDPQDVSVDDLVALIENLPEDKRQELLSRVTSGDLGDVGESLGL